jgi:drug/metabolite transporter (DMT)-like permease
MSTVDSSSASSWSISRWFSNQSNEFICEMEIVVSICFFGLSFVCQKQAMTNGMQPITYNAFRYLVSTGVLYVLKECFQLKICEEDSLSTHKPKTKAAEQLQQQHSTDRQLTIVESFFNQSESRQLIIFGILLSLCNFGGSMLQQIGLVYVTAGRAGFITGMFVIFVPIVEFLFIPKYRHHMNLGVILSVFISFSGLYLLSGCLESEHCIGGALGMGDLIVFISMLFWVVAIIVSDYGAKSVDVIAMTFNEFLLTTIFTFCFAFYFESSNFVYPFSSIVDNWQMIVIVGFTEALAFALSTLGQMYTPPTRATILFSMESVSCATLAYFLIGEKLTYIEIFGAGLMTSAALLSSFTAAVDEDEEEEELDEEEGEAGEKDRILGGDGNTSGDDYRSYQQEVPPRAEKTIAVSHSSGANRLTNPNEKTSLLG